MGGGVSKSKSLSAPCVIVPMPYHQHIRAALTSAMPLSSATSNPTTAAQTQAYQPIWVSLPDDILTIIFSYTSSPLPYLLITGMVRVTDKRDMPPQTLYVMDLSKVVSPMATALSPMYNMNTSKLNVPPRGMVSQLPLTLPSYRYIGHGSVCMVVMGHALYVMLPDREHHQPIYRMDLSTIKATVTIDGKVSSDDTFPCISGNGWSRVRAPVHTGGIEQIVRVDESLYAHGFDASGERWLAHYNTDCDTWTTMQTPPFDISDHNKQDWCYVGNKGRMIGHHRWYDDATKTLRNGELFLLGGHPHPATFIPPTDEQLRRTGHGRDREGQWYVQQQPYHSTTGGGPSHMFAISRDRVLVVNYGGTISEWSHGRWLPTQERHQWFLPQHTAHSSLTYIAEWSCLLFIGAANLDVNADGSLVPSKGRLNVGRDTDYPHAHGLIWVLDINDPASSWRILPYMLNIFDTNNASTISWHW